jgi:hypothetical protein
MSERPRQDKVADVLRGGYELFTLGRQLNPEKGQPFGCPFFMGYLESTVEIIGFDVPLKF